LDSAAPHQLRGIKLWAALRKTSLGNIGRRHKTLLTAVDDGPINSIILPTVMAITLVACRYGKAPKLSKVARIAVQGADNGVNAYYSLASCS
jgi:hypothetical protein